MKTETRKEKVMNQTTKNVVNINPKTPTPPTFLGHQWVKNDVTFGYGGFRPVSEYVSSEQERMQLNSLAEWFGYEMPKSVTDAYAKFPVEMRHLNSNNKDWRTLWDNKTTPISFEQWWEDCIFVLSKTIPELASDWFEPISNYPKELKVFFGKRCRNRLKYPNKKKMSFYKSYPDLSNEQTLEKVCAISQRLSSFAIWSQISKNIPKKYVTSHYLPISRIPSLLKVGLFTEIFIPVIGTVLMKDDWERQDEPEFIQENFRGSVHESIGDGAFLYAFLLDSIQRGNKTHSDITELLDNEFFDSHFGQYAETLRSFLITALKTPDQIPVRETGSQLIDTFS